MPASPPRYRFDHVHLRSRDAIAAARFYVDLFCAREISRDGEPAVSRVTLDIGGLTVFIEQAPAETTAPAAPPHLGLEHLGFCVDDIEAEVAALRRRGVTFTTDILVRHPGLRVTFLKGPDGASIELLERSDAP